MRAMIMAAGEGKRWGLYQGLPKQAIYIDGERLIDRTIRLLRERGIKDITVKVPSSGYLGLFDAKEVVTYDSVEIDKFLTGPECDLYLWGDTYYTDEAMDTILKPSSTPMFYGCYEEMFALKMTREVRLLAENLRNMKDSLKRCASWELYRLYNGIDLYEHQITRHFTYIEDETNDFDYPRDYDEFMRKHNPKYTLYISFSRLWCFKRWSEMFQRLILSPEETQVICIIDSKSKKLENNLRELLSRYGWLDLSIITTNNNKLRGEYGNAPARRERILNNMRTLINRARGEYVMAIEDDTLVPPDAFVKLEGDFHGLDNCGFVQGLELCRWGLRIASNWQFTEEDGQLVKAGTPMPPETGIGEIQGGGFYCFFTRKDIIKQITPRVEEGPPFMGPDVAFVWDIYKLGYKCYNDFDVKCIHMRRGKSDVTTDQCSAEVWSVRVVNDKWSAFYKIMIDGRLTVRRYGDHPEDMEDL